MTLLELTEPLFQFVCRLNRSARKGATVPDATQVRAAVKAIFEDMKKRAQAERGVTAQFDKVELVLMGFVDFMIKESGRSYARGWKELAYERNELAMDERFFDMLDETLRDPSEAATERLGVFYTCIGLGFTGWYEGQPEVLRQKMIEISHRIRESLDTGGGRLCPEAYEHVDKRVLHLPPLRSIMPILVVVVLASLVVLAVNVVAYTDARGELTKALAALKGTGPVGESGKEAGK